MKRRIKHYLYGKPFFVRNENNIWVQKGPRVKPPTKLLLVVLGHYVLGIILGLLLCRISSNAFKAHHYFFWFIIIILITIVVDSLKKLWHELKAHLYYKLFK